MIDSWFVFQRQTQAIQAAFAQMFPTLFFFFLKTSDVYVQFALNKNCALEVYGVFAVYHLGFLLNNFSRVINISY